MLIFDLGMNAGDNTEYFLRKGHKVVAVEANPVLCRLAEYKFMGRDLTIVNAAVCESDGKKPFYVSENSQWSSLYPNWVKGLVDTIEVPTMTLGTLYKRFGQPWYVKSDIEGADIEVLRQLAGLTAPQYLSVEDCRFGFEYLEMMRNLGYKGFQIIEQNGKPTPFGDDLHWISYSAAVDNYSNTVRHPSGKRIAKPSRWFDIHCAL